MPEIGEGPNKAIILLADDQATITDILSVVLEARGFGVIKSHDGNDAWNQIENNLPDLAILDIVMPGMNGLDLCKKIKITEKTKNIPVIIMTAITQDTDLADGFWKLGTNADDFVSKPFDPYEFADKVEKLLADKLAG